MKNRLIFAAACCAAFASPASAVLPGWDSCKWNDSAHQTPKYVVGRIVAAYPHTPAGLKSALPIIRALYPGTEILPGKGDKVNIPCVGTIDLVASAGTGGTGWWWGAETNECGKCSPNRCEEVSKSVRCGGNEGPGAGPGAGTGAGTGGEAGSGFGGATGNCAGVRVPNEKNVVVQTANENPDAWSAKLNPDEPACRLDSRFLDLVVDNLRKKDLRWGYNCKRGKCGDPSHDVVAYYFGQGQPYEGAPQVMLVDMIGSTCAPDAKPSWHVIEPNFGNGSGAGWTSKGRFPSGPRQNVRMNCPQKSEAPTASVNPIGGSSSIGGGTTGSTAGGGGGGGGSPSASGSGARKPAKKGGSIGVRNDDEEEPLPAVSSTPEGEGEEPAE